MTATPPRLDPKRRRRRRRRIALLVAAALTVAAFVTGCTSTVRPPPRPDDPVHVYLLAEALHTGLVLPPDDRDGEWVEFGFGDWSWYALGNEAWYHAFATVLWPTSGGLGRRTFGARTEDELRRIVHWAELSPIPVARQQATALRAHLQARFDQSLENAVWRHNLGFRFVPTDESYWFPHNCADAVADWLHQLDCQVTWVPIRLALRVEPQD